MDRIEALEKRVAELERIEIERREEVERNRPEFARLALLLQRGRELSPARRKLRKFIEEGTV